MKNNGLKFFGINGFVVLVSTFACPISSAQTVELYKNDFNTPRRGASECEEGLGGPGWLEHGTFADDYSTAALRFSTAGSVDRMCFTSTNTATNAGIFVDPKDAENRYAGSFATVKTRGANGRGATEGVGLLLEPQNQKFINFSMDWSRINIPDPNQTWPPVGDVEVTIGFYKVPAGNSFWVASNGAYGPPAVGSAGDLVSPVIEKKVVVKRSNRDPAQGLFADWVVSQESIDLGSLGFGLTDRVGIAFYPLTPNSSDLAYVAFDNMLVSASPTALYLPAPVVLAPDNTTDTTPIITGSGPVSTAMTLTISDSAGIVQTYSVTTDAGGNFSLDLGAQPGAKPLAIGAYTATVSYSDAAGQTVSATDQGSIVSAPITPPVVSAPDNTTDTTPVITGSGPASTAMTLTISDSAGTVQTFSVTTDPGGNFSLDLGAQPGIRPLAIGAYTATISYVDATAQTVSATDQGSVIDGGGQVNGPVSVPVDNPIALMLLGLGTVGVALRKLRKNRINT